MGQRPGREGAPKVRRAHTLPGPQQGGPGVCIQRITLLHQRCQGLRQEQGYNLSIGSTKTLLHNATMVDRFIAMSAKHANLLLNNTDFKKLLFYGIRTVA